jgi:hypothetical protein
MPEMKEFSIVVADRSNSRNSGISSEENEVRTSGKVSL